MKNKILNLITCIVTLCVCCWSSPAQTKQTSHDFSAFDALEVDYDFNVRVVESRKYSITLNVEDVLKDYIQAYVKNHTLYITLDEKSVPSDVKKMFRGRRAAAPILDATVYTPDPLASVKLSGSSVLAIDQELKCKDFVIDLSENAVISRLTVDAGQVTITSAGKSSADLVVYADDIKLNAAGSSKISLEQDSQNLTIVSGSSAEIDVEGETLDASLTTSGSSKVYLTGKTNNLTVTGSGSSYIDAINLKTSDCSVKLSNSCKVYEAATEALHLDMAGNSTVVFDGEPKIDVINIKSSTVQRYANVKK